VLGDLPLLGKLFRSKSTSSQKRNLLIFVTARLVNAAGGAAKATPRAGEAGISAPIRTVTQLEQPKQGVSIAK
jgi:general secretion pathway protein D